VSVEAMRHRGRRREIGIGADERNAGSPPGVSLRAPATGAGLLLLA
jgi:hypothetical protein